MKREVLIIPEVRNDLREAEAWYRSIDTRLGARFRAEFRSMLDHLADFAEGQTLFYRDVRHMVFRNFPYALYYRIKHDAVRVILVFHTARDPKNLHSALRGRD